MIYDRTCEHRRDFDKYGDQCTNPARHIMRCQNSGFTYDVCGIHRLVFLRRGDTDAGTIRLCPTCKRDGWVTGPAVSRAEGGSPKRPLGPARADESEAAMEERSQ